LILYMPDDTTRIVVAVDPPAGREARPVVIQFGPDPLFQMEPTEDETGWGIGGHNIMSPYSTPISIFRREERADCHPRIQVANSAPDTTPDNNANAKSIDQSEWVRRGIMPPT